MFDLPARPCFLVHLCFIILVSSMVLSDQHLKIIDGQPQNWTQAVHTCVKNGLQIAQPSTAEKSSQLETQFFSAIDLSKLNISWVWIGLKYDIPTKTYYWEDGTSMSWSNWIDGQPDKTKTTSFLCVKVKITKDFNWAVENCSVSFQVLCETQAIKPILPVNDTNEDDIKVINGNSTTTNTTVATTVSVTKDEKDSDDFTLWPAADAPVMMMLGLGILLILVLIGIGYTAWNCFLQGFIEGKPTIRRKFDENSPLQDFR